MTRRVKQIIITISIAMALFVPLCAVEGGAPGREVCVNCEE